MARQSPGRSGGAEVKEKDPDWRRNITKIRQAKLDWILNNVDISKLDAYNPIHSENLAQIMFKAGAIRVSTNKTMVAKSLEKLILEARKIKGFK